MLISSSTGRVVDEFISIPILIRENMNRMASTKDEEEEDKTKELSK